MSTTAVEAGEDRRKEAARALFAIQRVVKALALHALNNQTVMALLESAVTTAAETCAANGVATITLVFAGDTIFINGQVLRAGRDLHAIAVDFGKLLDACHVNELAIDHDLTVDDVGAFALAIAKTPTAVATLGRKTIRARRVNTALAGSDATLPPAARVGKVYAIAVVVMREVQDALRANDHGYVRKVKRVAQKLAVTMDSTERLMLAVAATPAAAADPAALAVKTAILSLGVARTLTQDRAVLSNLTMAALTLDAGRPRLTRGTGGVDRLLNSEEEARVPASLVVNSVIAGKLHAASVTRTVVAHEALWLRRQNLLGPVYGGRRGATVLARVLDVARAFVDLRSTSPGRTALRVDDAVDLLFRRANSTADRALVKLLYGALGFLPIGTLVELDTGEIAAVRAAPEHPIDFPRPPVRVLYGRDGELLETPFDVDLAGPSGMTRRVVRPIPTDDSKVAAMRAAMREAEAREAEARGRASLAPPSLRPQPAAATPPTQPQGSYGVSMVPPPPSAFAMVPPPPGDWADDAPPSSLRVPSSVQLDDAGDHTRAVDADELLRSAQHEHAMTDDDPDAATRAVDITELLAEQEGAGEAVDEDALVAVDEDALIAVDEDALVPVEEGDLGGLELVDDE